jgi:hypothetical protein
MMRLRLNGFRPRDSRLDHRIRDLLWDWDPLENGDSSDPYLPASEYDWLIVPLVSRIQAREEAVDIRAFLVGAVRERYGVHGDEEMLQQLVKRLVDLRQDLSP